MTRSPGSGRIPMAERSCPTVAAFVTTSRAFPCATTVAATAGACTGPTPEAIDVAPRSGPLRMPSILPPRPSTTQTPKP